MSKGMSGLFKGTNGFLHALGEGVFERIMPNGDKFIDFSHLPGSNGVQIKHRLTDEQMSFLTNEYGVEFAQVYILGSGPNGRGGKYYLYSGTKNRVYVPVNANTILINHTHPGGTAHPSMNDLKLMDLFSQLGSPQKKSSIIPIGKHSIKFTKNGKVE